MRSTRRMTFVGITLGVVFVFVSSMFVYSVAAGYTKVYSDETFDIWLRIDNINIEPQDFAVVTVTVKILSKSPSDIDVHEFTVKAYSIKPDRPRMKQYGEDSVTNLLIPAHDIKTLKLNLKVSNYTYFKYSNKVWVDSYVCWTHFGTTFERWDTDYIKMSPWRTLLIS